VACDVTPASAERTDVGSLLYSLARASARLSDSAITAYSALIEREQGVYEGRAHEYYATPSALAERALELDPSRPDHWVLSAQLKLAASILGESAVDTSLARTALANAQCGFQIAMRRSDTVLMATADSVIQLASEYLGRP
jgi:hypothetical protein